MKEAEMLSFKDYNSLIPTLKDKVNGKLIKGKRGDTHQDLLPANDRMKNYDLGFYHTKKKKYYSRYHDNLRLHSTDLMTKAQRFRRFNTEEKKAETDKNK